MAELSDLLCHRSDFTPHAPIAVSDECKCPHCGALNTFSKWIYHGAMGNGYFCYACNDVHSCFECPACGEYFGAAGSSSDQIEVVSHKGGA